jgi:mono/diheme cytochrome c family protein
MSRANSAVRGIVAAVVLVSGGHGVASAQQRGGAAPQQQDPTKITVSSRVYDKKQLLSAPAVSEDAQRGRALWLQRCAYCHDGVGQPSYQTMGSWLGAETVQTLGEVAVRAIVAAGTPQMPGFRYTLQSQQMNDLIAFLKTVPSDQKPTPAQLAGKAPGAGSND